MGNLWLKIRIWTKTTLFTVVLIYSLLFIFKNSEETVSFWWWFGHNEKTSVLFLVAGTFFAGVIVTALSWTMFKTIKQMRTLRDNSRMERIEREQADMKAKAAMLHSKPPGGFEVNPDPNIVPTSNPRTPA